MTFESRLSAFIFVSLAAGFVATGCQPKEEPADLVLRGGKIVTMDEAKPAAEALAIRGDTIVAVGPNQDIKPFIGSATEVVELDGNLAVPGLIEGHGHFLGVGRAKMQLNLMETKNWDEIVGIVAEAVKNAEPAEWIRGRGWHQEKWDKVPEPNVDGLPFHDALSKVSPDNPVLLSHASGHATFANAKAMEMSGVTKATKPPDGGEIVRDSKGNPIGVFRETASGLVSPGSEWNEPTATKMAMLAAEECLSKGITSFHDAGSSSQTIDLFRKLANEGKMGVRLYVMISGSNETLAEELPKYRILNEGNNHLTVRSIKKLIDGALGPHGAWLLEPYEDMPSSTGLNTQTVEDITETARLAMENDFQLCVHAIGDRANRETLDIYEAAFTANPDKKDTRWRIEHAQHINADDIPRFGELGVIAAMQGIHCTSDAPYFLQRLGETRAEEGAYVWQKLMATGAVIANGTDAPVEDVDPLASYYATVSRKLKDGTVFFADQRMSREEALKSYTLNNALAAFEEDIKGSLSIGKLGDVTVLSKDIMTIPEDEIPKTEVLYTIVGGKVLYKKAKATD
jgi:predicted amidohydrolase YtcJ